MRVSARDHKYVIVDFSDVSKIDYTSVHVSVSLLFYTKLVIMSNVNTAIIR